jgi:hypothetical protein
MPYAKNKNIVSKTATLTVPEMIVVNGSKTLELRLEPDPPFVDARLAI